MTFYKNEKWALRAEFKFDLMKRYAFTSYLIFKDNHTKNLIRLHDFGLIHKTILKIKGKYLRYTNRTQKYALKVLEASHPSTPLNKCPHCKDFSTRDIEYYADHISKVHGYPKDMVVIEYERDTTVPRSTELTPKANPEYLKYL